jgi:hypothetical protein
MPQTRGFVVSIEVGRASRVTATVIKDDASTADFVIRDLDADPERFNERLSKVGLLRDALSRAEPVEIEHHQEDDAEVIDTVRRITRDALGPPGSELATIAGIVLGLDVAAQNRAQADGEVPDVAYAAILDDSLQIRIVAVALQAPERAAAIAQLDVLEQAYATGDRVVCLVDTGDDLGDRVLQVSVGSSGAGSGRDGEIDEIDGFVESISLLPLSGLGSVSLIARLGVVELTTAPPFVAAGNVVATTDFTPEPLTVVVPEGSPSYELLEAGLRDTLRVRVGYRRMRGKDGDEVPPVVRVMALHEAVSSDVPASERFQASAAKGGGKVEVALVTGVELLAPLASASRPVWTCIERSSLDLGPEVAPGCAPDSPSSDLQAATLRDLRLPYPALWQAWGCANHGVYRFQVKVKSDFTLTVDGRELCLVDSAEGDAKMAHACLEGEIEVEIRFAAWTCDQNFDIDVYRLR